MAFPFDMAIKNFREDRDIKLKPAAPRASASALAIGEIRTMAKDLAVVRDHLAAERAPRPTRGGLSLSKPVLPKAPAKPAPSSELTKRPPAEAKQPGHLPFVRVFFEAVFGVAFLGLLVLAASYYWFIIRDTERLISEPLPLVYIGASRPVVEEVPPPAAPLLLTDQSQALMLADLNDQTSLVNQLSAAQAAPLNEGVFKQLVLTNADGQELPAASLASLLEAPLPAETTIEAYTLFIFGQQPRHTLGAVLKVAPATATQFFAALLTPAWQAQLVQFVERFGLVLAPDQSVEFQLATYRGQAVFFLNFADGTALDLIPFFEHQLLGIANSKEAALRLIDRVMIGF